MISEVHWPPQMLNMCSSKGLCLRKYDKIINVRGDDGGPGRGWEMEVGEGRKRK